MKRFFFQTYIVSGLLLCASLHAHAQGRARNPEANLPPGDVVAVQFDGNQNISSDELATITSTKVTGFFSRALYSLPVLKSAGAPYQTLDLATLQRDTAELNIYYRDHGFLLAKSTYRVRPNLEDEKAYNEYIRKERLVKRAPGEKPATAAPTIRDTVIYSIKEGPPFIISHVAMAGLESLPPQFQPELTERNTIKTGVRWTRPVVSKEIQRLTNLMVENGYPNFREDTIIVENIEGKTTVNVTVYFSPGHRYKYGPSYIVWDTVAERSLVAARVIKNQLYTDSGKWYKLSEVTRSEAALNRLGTFELVRVSLDTSYISRLPDSLRDSAAVPVQVFLRMGQVGGVQVGIYGGEAANGQGAIVGGNVGYVDRNLTRTADLLNVQASYQPLPTTMQRYSATIDYHIPDLIARRVPLVFGLGGTRQFQTVSPAYDQLNLFGHLGTTLYTSRLDDKTTVTPDVLLEYITTSTNDSTIRATSPPRQVNNLFSFGFQNDRTNDPINVTKGNLFSAAVEYALPLNIFGPLLGLTAEPSTYTKFTVMEKYYLDLTDTGKAVIATKLRAGITVLQKANDSASYPSLNHRFFAGGGTSNRGWAEQALVLSDNPAWSGLSGGYNDFEWSLEFRYAPFQYTSEFTSWQKLSSPLRVVVFSDVSNVWDNSFFSDPSWARDPSRLAWSVGFGIRYNLFFAPLRVDCGFKMWDPSGRFDDGSQAITPHDTGKWLWQAPALFLCTRTFNWSFGIGQAF